MLIPLVVAALFLVGLILYSISDVDKSIAQLKTAVADASSSALSAKNMATASVSDMRFVDTHLKQIVDRCLAIEITNQKMKDQIDWMTVKLQNDRRPTFPARIVISQEKPWRVIHRQAKMKKKKKTIALHPPIDDRIIKKIVGQMDKLK